MKDKVSISIFICLIVYFMAICISPIHLDFFDAFIVHLISGIATRNVITDTPLGFFYLTPFFSWLAGFDNRIPWVGITALGFFFSVNLAFVFLVIRKVKEGFPTLSSLKIYAAGIPVFFIIQFTSIVKPSFTGLSILLCGCAPLIVETIVNSQFSRIKQSLIYLGAVLFYLGGALIRFDTPLAAAAISGLFILLTSQSIKKSILFQIPLVALSLVMFCHTFGKVTNIPFIKSTEVALFYLGDGFNDNDILDGLNSKDSIKAVAVRNFFLNDEKELSIDFINGLASKKLSAEKKMKTEFFKRLFIAWRIAMPSIIANIHYLILNCLFLIFCFWSQNEFKYRMAVFQLLFWVIVFSIAYLSKLEDRHYLYLVQLFSYCNLLFLFQNNRLLLKKIASTVFTIIIGTLFVLFSCEAYSKKPEQETTIVNRDLAEIEVNSMANGKLLLLDGDSKDIFYGGPLTIRPYDSAKEIMFYDMGHLALLPEYNAYLDDLCKCNSRKIMEFYSFLELNKAETLIISSEERVAFISSYLKLVHNKNLNIEKLQGEFAINKIQVMNGSLYYYVLK